MLECAELAAPSSVATDEFGMLARSALAWTTQTLADLYELPAFDWSSVTDRLDAGCDQAPGSGGPDRHTRWLTTIDPDGTEEAAGGGLSLTSPDRRPYFTDTQEARRRRMRLTLHQFLTLDGVCQAPGGQDEDREGGFEHGGWQAHYRAPEAGATVAGWFGQASAFLLGRRTYDNFSAPVATREPRGWVRHRAKLVGLRSNLKCQVHGVLAGAGVMVAMSDLFGVGGQRLLAGARLAPESRARVESAMRLIEALDFEVELFAKLVAGRLRTDGGYQAIQVIPGVGPLRG